MAIASYANPSTRRLGGTFYNASGVATDPAGAVKMTVETPAGVETVYTYALAQLTKGSTGYFYRDVLLNASGRWKYLIEADMSGDGVFDTSDGTEIDVRTRVL